MITVVTSYIEATAIPSQNLLNYYANIIRMTNIPNLNGTVKIQKFKNDFYLINVDGNNIINGFLKFNKLLNTKNDIIIEGEILNSDIEPKPTILYIEHESD